MTRTATLPKLPFYSDADLDAMGLAGLVELAHSLRRGLYIASEVRSPAAAKYAGRSLYLLERMIEPRIDALRAADPRPTVAEYAAQVRASFGPDADPGNVEECVMVAVEIAIGEGQVKP
jgi:hypothetical protein